MKTDSFSGRRVLVMGLGRFGGGVDVPLAGRFRVFVEGRYQMSFTEEDRTDHSIFAAGLRIGGWW